MSENEFYHEDLVINVDHVNRAIHCGHVEGEAFNDFNESTNITSTESLDHYNISEIPIVPPNQFGDKSSDHDETIDSMLMDPENQFESGYFDGPFHGNIYVRWNSDYFENMALLNNEVPTFDEYISGENLIKMDRYHQLSDIVKHSNTSNIGIVNKIKKKAYAEIIGANKLLADIDCSKLKNIEKFFPGTNEQLVIHNSWLGRVTSVMRDVILKFPDGAKLRTSENTVENFEPIFNSNLSDIIFRGSTLKGDARDLKSKSTKFTTETLHYNSTWFKQLHQQQIVEVIIVKVIISSAKVDWLMFKPENGNLQSEIESPPPIIKGPNIQNLKSVNSNPFLYCYTGDIWYYQLKIGDKIYNLNEEYTISKLLYKIYMKENINHLRFFVKPNKQAKEKETKITPIKKIEKSTPKKISINLKSEKKTKPSDDKQDNQNYLANSKEEIIKTNNYESKRNKSIYHHLQYRCSKDQLFFRPKSSGSCLNYNKNKTLDTKFSICSNEDQLMTINSNTNSVEDYKDLSAKSSKNTLVKKSKKLNYQQLKVTREMVISYLANLVAGTWVPIHLILLESLIDITWQNGSISHAIPSIKLIPELFEIDEYDFFPGDFVSPKKANNELNVNENITNSTFGCVLKAINSERITFVQWFRVLSDNLSSKIGKPEQCGSYDVKHHRKHHYHIGDIVAISSSCSKTNFPAGCVKSVQPSRGKLSITWCNSKETLLSPADLHGVVWDLVSDEFFTSSEETLEMSSVNLQHELENFKFENTLVSFNKQESSIRQTTNIIRQMLQIIENIKFYGLKIETEAIPDINTKYNELLMILNSKIVELKSYSKDKSINIICESFSSNLPSEKDLEQIETLNIMENQQAPSTSKLMSKNIVENFATLKEPFGSKIRNHTISKENFDEGKLLRKISEKDIIPIKNQKREENDFNEILLNKIFDLEKSLNNWLKINSITQISADKTHDVLVDKETKFENQIQIIDKTNIQKQEIEKKTATSLSHKIEPFNDDLNRSEDYFSTSDGNVYKRWYQESPTERFNSSIYEPLPTEQLGFFSIVDCSPENHKYIKLTNTNIKNKMFTKAWTRDCNLLSTSLPKGIWIKNFEQKSDLFSVMIEGPEGTPYQHTLFFFDIHLTPDYPQQPPQVHYSSLTNDKVNPNLYPDGRVCLSLLGTWIGRGTENWNPKISNLLQILVSIQGLILVIDPYFNEAGFEHRRGTLEGITNCQRYNESIITSLSIAMANLIENPLKYFKQEIINYYLENGRRYTSLLQFWSSLNDTTYKNYVDNNRISITEIQSSSEITRSICSNINWNSLKNEANTEAISSIWSEEVLTAEINNITKTEIPIELEANIKKKKTATIRLPQFPLAPVSKGFSITLKKYIPILEYAIEARCRGL